ncbi:ABC transporter ATP-binding protein [Nocardiopsis baichengensis]|uniref:ABC transporter ATP-binding protein n=1 Tax=Nocardiopsis baichengensis TaxID=280240 RepID=UPI000349536A|nr:ABC transporter ATP-binding protein [Nocardiopsis baichengensis]
MATAPPVLAVEQLTVAFGGLTALDRVTFDVPHRSVVGLIGPNGAGKTTVFNAVSGVVRPRSGTLTRHGRPLRRHRPHHLPRLGISRMLQGLGLFSGMTVLENVMVGADPLATGRLPGMLTGLGRAPRDERRVRERAESALREFGVAHAAHALPGTLPYGVQKRVALARACVCGPELLLLDEPASGLSADEMSELAERVRAMRAYGSVLLVEHHMDLVMRVCDRVVVLDFGRVIADGTPDEVRADPAVERAYLGPAEGDPDDPAAGPAPEAHPTGEEADDGR